MSRLRSIAATMVATAALAVPIAAVAPAAEAAGTVPSAISLGAPASGVYGSNITLTGRLWRYGTPYGIGGAAVWLQRTPHGRVAWANVRSGRTASNGNYAFAVTHTGAYDYRVYYAGSAVYRAAVSPVRYPVVNQNLVLDSVATTNPTTGTLRATGRVYPSPPNGTVVYLQRWSSDARAWVNLAGGRTSGGNVTVVANRPGSVTSYRLVVPARSPYGAGVSATRLFAHHVWRGAFVKPVLRTSGSGGHNLLGVDDPKRQVHVYVLPNSTFRLAVDAAGCRSARVDTVAGSSNTATIRLYLHNDTRLMGNVQLPQNSGVSMSGDLHANPQLVELSVDNQGVGAVSTVLSNMMLLCAN